MIASQLATVAAGALIKMADTPVPVPDELASPGPWGFAITFLVAAAAVLIIYDMIRRVRRINYRADIRRKIEEEEAEAAAAAATGEESGNFDPR